MNDLDRLGVQIEAEDKKASSALDSLEKSLSEIANLLKGMKVDSSMSKGLSDIAKGAKDIASAIRGLNSSNIESVGKAAKSASSDVKEAARGMKEFSESTKEVTKNSKDVAKSLADAFNIPRKGNVEKLTGLVQKLYDAMESGTGAQTARGNLEDFIATMGRVKEEATDSYKAVREVLSSYKNIRIPKEVKGDLGDDYARIRSKLGKGFHLNTGEKDERGNLKGIGFDAIIQEIKDLTGMDFGVDKFGNQIYSVTDMITNLVNFLERSEEKIYPIAQSEFHLKEIGQALDYYFGEVAKVPSNDPLGEFADRLRENSEKIVASSEELERIKRNGAFYDKFGDIFATDYASRIAGDDFDAAPLAFMGDALNDLRKSTGESINSVDDLISAFNRLNSANVKPVDGDGFDAIEHGAVKSVSAIDRIIDTSRQLSDILRGSGEINFVVGDSAIENLVRIKHEYQDVIKGMETEKIDFDTSAYNNAVIGFNLASEAIKQYKQNLIESAKESQVVANSANNITTALSTIRVPNFTFGQDVTNSIPELTGGIETTGTALVTLEHTANAAGTSVAKIGQSASNALSPLRREMEVIDVEFVDLKKATESVKSLNIDTSNLDEVISKLNSMALSAEEYQNVMNNSQYSASFKSVVSDLQGAQLEYDKTIEKMKEIEAEQAEIENFLSKPLKAEVAIELKELHAKKEEIRRVLGGEVDSLLEKIDNLAEQMISMGDSGEAKFTQFDKANEEINNLISKIKEYKEIVSSMDAGKTPFDAKSYREASIGLDDATESLKRYKDEIMKGQPDVNVNTDGLSREIEKLLDKTREYKKVISDMETGRVPFDDKGYRDAVIGLDNATAAFKRYKDGITQGQPDIDAKSKQIAQSIMGIAKNFNPAGILAPFRRVVEGISNMLSQLQRFWNRAMRTFTFMLVRKAITAILKDTHAAMQSLANFNSYVGTAFNQSMSSIVSNFRWLGANIVAAFAPLVNAVAPIIDFVITKIVQLVTAVNMLFAKLTGADHYVTAQKKMINFAQSVSTSANTIDNSIGSGVSNATKPIADSYKPITNTNKALGDTGKALKKLKSYTLGFDELNIIEPDDYDWLGDLADDIGDLGDVSSSMPDLSDIGDLGSYNPPSITFPSGSISGDAYEWVEHELPGWFKDADMFEIGKWISDNLTETLANIDWDSIYEKARNFGSGLARFLNGLITPELFYQVGRTIAKALGTVVQWALKLGEEFDFKNLGESLAAAVNGFFQNFPFADLANTIDAWVQGIWTTIKTFVANIKWGDVLNGLKEFFGNLDPETYALLISLWFGKSLLKGITSGISLVKVAIAKVITDKLTDVIKMSLGKAMAGKAIEGAAGKAAGGAAGGLFGNIGASISGALSTIAPFVASIGGAVVAVGSFFDMWNNGWSVLKEVLKDIGIAIAAVGLVIAGVVTGPIAAIGAAVVAAASTIAIVIHDNWDAISNFFANTIPAWWSGTAVPFLQSIPQKVAEVFGSIPEKISGAMSAIKRKVSDVVNAIGQWFSELPYKIGSALGFVVGHLFKWGMDIGNWAKDNIPKIVDGIVQWFKSLPEKIGEFLTGVVAKFKEWGQGLLTWITTEIPKVIDSIASFFISLPQKLFDAIRGFIDKLIEWKNACISWITTNVPAIAESIISFFISLPSRFIQIGKDILQGLWNGITWAWQTVKEGIANFARGFVDTFKSVLGIHSPSTVAAEIGTFFVQGLVQPFTGSSYIAPVNTFLGKFTGMFTEKIGSTWKSLDKNTDSTFKGVQTTVKGSLQSVQEDTTGRMTGIQSSLTTVWRSVNQSVTDQFQQMQRKVESANNAVVSSFRQAWNQIPAIISGAMQSARNSIDAIVGGVDTLKSAFSTMGSSVQSFDRSMSEVANTLSRVETPIKKVADIIADLKKAFDTTLRFKVMVPVFAMRGKFDAESGQVPEVYIQYWNTYAHGGFPEDGFFFANSSELVGRFTNGRTAVANNAQIIEGIKRGVYEAVLESQGGNGREVDLLEQILDATRQGKTISIDGRELVGTIENRQRRNGYAFQAV